MKQLSEITTGQELANEIDAICKTQTTDLRPFIIKLKRTISEHGGVFFSSDKNDFSIFFGIYQWGAGEPSYLSVSISWQEAMIWDERFDSIETGLSCLRDTLDKMADDAKNMWLLFLDRRQI